MVIAGTAWAICSKITKRDDVRLDSLKNDKILVCIGLALQVSIQTSLNGSSLKFSSIQIK